MSGGHGDGSAASVGRPGKAAQASRTVEIVMTDNAFAPASLTVTPGETVRFVVRNDGEFVHEFSIGTPDMHAAHQAEMMMMMQHGALLPDRVDEDAMRAMQAAMAHGMHDDSSGSLLLEPGESGEVVWTFPTEAGSTLEFACNVPGHYQSGMMGAVRFNGAS